MTSAQNWTKSALLGTTNHNCLSVFLIMRLKRHHCSKSHILATDQPVAVLQALNQILQCTQGCEWYPWKPLDRKHPEGFLYLWGLQYVQMVCEIYTQDVCPKQNALDLATTRTPNQRDGFLCRMLKQTICTGKSAFYGNCHLLGLHFKYISPLTTIGYIYENSQLSCLIHVSSSGYSVASSHCKDLVSNHVRPILFFSFFLTRYNHHFYISNRETSSFQKKTWRFSGWFHLSLT